MLVDLVLPLAFLASSSSVLALPTALSPSRLDQRAIGDALLPRSEGTQGNWVMTAGNSLLGQSPDLSLAGPRN